MRVRRGIASCLLGLALSACASHAVSSVAAPVVPSLAPNALIMRPTAAPSPAIVPSFDADFAHQAPGQVPGDWLDVATRENWPWLVAGNWAIARDPVSGTPALEQSGMSWPWYGGSPPLSFMRYNAATFGNGLPDRYTVDVVLRVRGCDWRDPYYPIGDTGVQIYFVDARHYAEVVYRPETFEVWQCDGGAPDQAAHWTLLGRYQNKTWSGATLRVHASVSLPEKQLVVQLPGGPSVTLKAPMLASVPHWLTLRASNSLVDYDQVRISSP